MAVVPLGVAMVAIVVAVAATMLLAAALELTSLTAVCNVGFVAALVTFPKSVLRATEGSTVAASGRSPQSAVTSAVLLHAASGATAAQLWSANLAVGAWPLQMSCRFSSCREQGTSAV